MLADLGLNAPSAAKMLHVSLRTLHNWLSGRHEVPYSAYKLLRLMRYMELPGKGWQGWHFSRGELITPEGRAIAAGQGAWWSMLVRQAQGFGQLYRENINLKLQRAENAVQRGPACGDTAPAFSAGLVPSKTSIFPTSIQNLKSSQHDVTMMSWPTLYDSPTPLTLPPEPAPIILGSVSTPSFALPLTPICGGLPPSKPLNLGSVPHLKQVSPVLSPSNHPRLPLLGSPALRGRSSPASSGSQEKPGVRPAPAKAGGQVRSAGGAV